VSTSELVHMDRFQDLDYVVQVGRLKALHEKFRSSLIISERNSMGEPLLELLYSEGLPVSGFQTTNQSKAKVIEAQVLAFEREKLKIINEPVLIEELQAYELERMPGGLIRYQTPQGLHDNTVISAALAWYAVGRIGPVVLW
jgi:hypothetical protein